MTALSVESAAVALAVEARRYGAASVADLHDVIDANEAIADALTAAGFDPLDHDAAGLVSAAADEILAEMAR